MIKKYLAILAFVGFVPASHQCFAADQDGQEAALLKFLKNSWQSEREKLFSGKVKIVGQVLNGDEAVLVQTTYLTFDHSIGCTKAKVENEYPNREPVNGIWLRTPDFLTSVNLPPASGLLILLKPRDPHIGFVTNRDPRCFGLTVRSEFADLMEFGDIVKYLDSKFHKAQRVGDKFLITGRATGNLGARLSALVDPSKGYSVENFKVFIGDEGKGPVTVASHANNQYTQINQIWVPSHVFLRGERNDCAKFDFFWEEVNGSINPNEFTVESFNLPGPVDIIDKRLNNKGINLGRIGSHVLIPEINIKLPRWRLFSPYTYFALFALACVSGYVLFVKIYGRVGWGDRAAGAKRDGGFTVLELLVVLSIIGILCSLVSCAVLLARSKALQLSCSNNLRQIGVGLSAYQTHFASFPPGCSYQDGKSPFPFMSWSARILPYIGQESVWKEAVLAFSADSNFRSKPHHRVLGFVQQVYACPSDSRTLESFDVGRFSVGLTSYLGISGANYQSYDGVLFLDSDVKASSITDGMSNTLLVGERPPTPDRIYGWWYAGMGQRDGSNNGSVDLHMGVSEVNLGLYSDCPPGPYVFQNGAVGDFCSSFHYWSLHSNGSGFLFADGSYKFLNYQSKGILPYLASRQGGEIIDLP